MRGHWFWDFAFLNSNYHLEHHYFPGVAFYRLPELQRALIPFYTRKGMRWQSYGRLVYGWLVENRAPHTDWSRPDSARRRRTRPHRRTSSVQPLSLSRVGVPRTFSRISSSCRGAPPPDALPALAWLAPLTIDNTPHWSIWFAPDPVVSVCSRTAGSGPRIAMSMTHSTS